MFPCEKVCFLLYLRNLYTKEHLNEIDGKACVSPSQMVTLHAVVHTKLNKLAKLRRHASRVHFASNSFGPIHFVLEHFRLFTLGLEHVSCHVGHLVHLHVGHHDGHLVHLHLQLHVGHFFILFIVSHHVGHLKSM